MQCALTLSAGARLPATGGDRETDPADALHVAQVAPFRTDLRKVTAEDQTTILRLPAEQHNDLVTIPQAVAARQPPLVRSPAMNAAPFGVPTPVMVS
jgi:hypothetical protein